MTGELFIDGGGVRLSSAETSPGATPRPRCR
jgi:hypothetical protein